MNNVRDRLLQQLKRRQEQGNLRSLKLKQDLVDFCSNDYLGLAKNPELKIDIDKRSEFMACANGATGSRLLTGNSALQMQLEEQLARFFQAPAALLFNSGYTANLGLLSTIPQRGDTILYDQAIHACVKDGARLSNAKCLSFRHNDIEDLERKLSASKGKRFVVIESLYSMEGDYSPIDQIAELCEEQQAELFIDEAHTTGWTGIQGRGLVVEHQLCHKFTARVYTFGKAMGVHGACVVGSRELIDYLINFARPFIYTTALPQHSVIAIQCALSMLEEDKLNNRVLQQAIFHYLDRASLLTIDQSLNANSPIQWIAAKSNQRSIFLTNWLESKGMDVRQILSPTVPVGHERLRICLHSFNTEQEITDLVEAISEQA